MSEIKSMRQAMVLLAMVVVVVMWRLLGGEGPSMPAMFADGLIALISTLGWI